MSSTSSPLIARAARRWRRIVASFLAEPVQPVVARAPTAPASRSAPAPAAPGAPGARTRPRAGSACVPPPRAASRRARPAPDPAAPRSRPRRGGGAGSAVRRAAAQAGPRPRSPPPRRRRPRARSNLAPAARAAPRPRRARARAGAGRSVAARSHLRRRGGAAGASWRHQATQIVGERRVGDRRGLEALAPRRPSREAMPATAPSIAMRWSPARVDACRRAALRRLRPRNRPGAASIRAPSPRRPSTTVVTRSDSLRRSSSAPRTIVVPSAKAPSSATSGSSSIASGTSSGSTSVPRSRAERTTRSATGSPPASRARSTSTSPPIRSSTRRKPGPGRVHAHSAQPHLRAGDERRRGDEERCRGEVPRDVHLAQLQPALRADGDAAVLGRRTPTPALAQHDLGVVARRESAPPRSSRRPPAARPAARTTSPARSRPAARTRCRARSDPSTTIGGSPPSRQSTVAPIRRSGCTTRSTGLRAMLSSPCKRPAPARLAGQPAGQQADQRAGVADVDRGRARVGAAQARAGQLQVETGATRLGVHEPGPERGHGLERGGRVRRAQVPSHPDTAVRHRSHDRGAMRDRLVRRRHELAGQSINGIEAQLVPPRAVHRGGGIPEARDRAPRPARRSPPRQPKVRLLRSACPVQGKGPCRRC